MSNVKTPDLLAAEVRKRRLALGISTVKELAELAGFTVKTGSSIENARQDAYRPQTLAQLERALGWAPGSAQAVLDGGEPTLLPLGDHPVAASRSSVRSGATPSSTNADSDTVVTLPASALEGLSEAELDEVESVGRAAALKRAREIRAAHVGVESQDR
jgi:transcriptional regulator with XRE-family HTH domain